VGLLSQRDWFEAERGWRWIGEAEREERRLKYWADAVVRKRALRAARVVVDFILAVVVFLTFEM